VLGLRPLARIPRAALAATALLGALALLSFLSIAWADSAENAFSESGRLLLYLGVFVVAVVATSRGSAGRIVDGLAVGIAAVAVLALLDRCFPHVINHGPITSDFKDDPRLTYPLNYWNGLSIFAGLAFPGLLRIALAGRTAATRALALAPLPALAGTIYLTSSRGGTVSAVVGVLAFVALADRRLAAAMATLVMALGSAATVAILASRDELVNGPLGGSAALSQGRSAALLIALVCALTGVAWLAVARLERPLPSVSRRWKAVLAGLALVVLVAGVAAANPASRLDSFKKPPPLPSEVKGPYTNKHLTSAGGNGRWQAWDAAVGEFRAHPVAGGGAGSYEAWWARHADISYVTRYAHSLYLQTLGELGLLGGALLLGLLATVGVTAGRRWRASRSRERGVLAAAIAMLVAWAAAAGIDWVWELPAIGVVGVVLLALLTGPGTAGSAEEASSDAPAGARRRNFIVRAGVGAVSVAVIASLAIPLLARDKIQDSQRAGARGDLSAAAAEARTARDVQPWAASPYQQLAIVQEQADDLRAARGSIGDALKRDPDSWRLWLLRARIEQESGRPAAASVAFDRAVELNPKSPLLTSLQRQARTSGASP
jgi:tetratricopeptide (TPR) repeat protein